MEIIAIIDKEKLPDDIRSILERLSKDKDKINDSKINTNDKINDNTADNKLYEMQTGTVVGNIYDKNFKLEDKGDS